MHKQYPITKGLPKAISIACIALISALAMGSVGPISAAQAAPASADSVGIDFKLTVDPEKLPKICLKGKLNLYAGMSKTVRKELGDTVWNLPRPMPAGPTRIDGSVISGTGTLKKQLQDIDGPPGTSVPFVFTADKPGKVTLRFTADIKNSWIGANEQVIGSGMRVQKEITFTVTPCKYKVKTITKFSAQGVIIVSTMDGEMKSDEQGNFTGSATVNWISGVTVGYKACSGVIDVASSQANLTGHQDDSDRLMAEVTYLPAVLTHTFDCGGNETKQAEVTPDPLALSVPSSGGVSTQSQDLYEPTYYAMHGSVDIVVIPEDDGAVAFNADSRVALSPFARWAMPWDNFPWSYSALR